MTVIFNCSLSEISYYKTGGRCSILFAPQSVDELIHYFNQVISSHQKYFILGAGSNSLVSDEYFDGAVFSLKDLNKIERISQNVISCEAGCLNSDVVRFAAQQSLSGLEWMNGLPGQIGGTTRMNARCYGGEISHVAAKVFTVDCQGREKMYTKEECFRGYKDTVFMENKEIIWKIHFELNPDKKVDFDLMEQCLQDRTQKGQYLHPSCGCVFKNNYSIGKSSGALLDEVGAKSLSVGNAVVSPQHANFIFNKGATSLDIVNLSLMMRDKVWQKMGYWLEYEMEILGNIPEHLKNKIKEKRS